MTRALSYRIETKVETDKLKGRETKIETYKIKGKEVGKDRTKRKKRTGPPSDVGKNRERVKERKRKIARVR